MGWIFYNLSTQGKCKNKWTMLNLNLSWRTQQTDKLRYKTQIITLYENSTYIRCI